MESSAETQTGLFRAILGTSWDNLHPTVQSFHRPGEPVHARGTFQIRHGTNWLAHWAAWFARMPSAGDCVAVQLMVNPQGDGEIWSRLFAGRPMRSFQSRLRNGLLAERMGAVEVRFRLEVVDGTLVYHASGAALRLGPLSLPIPRWLAPSVSACEKAGTAADTIEAAITVRSPVLGLMVSYGGTVTLMASESEAPPTVTRDEQMSTDLQNDE